MLVTFNRFRKHQRIRYLLEKKVFFTKNLFKENKLIWMWYQTRIFSRTIFNGQVCRNVTAIFLLLFYDTDDVVNQFVSASLARPQFHVHRCY